MKFLNLKISGKVRKLSSVCNERRKTLEIVASDLTGHKFHCDFKESGLTFSGSGINRPSFDKYIGVNSGWIVLRDNGKYTSAFFKFHAHGLFYMHAIVAMPLWSIALLARGSGVTPRLVEVFLPVFMLAGNYAQIFLRTKSFLAKALLGGA